MNSPVIWGLIALLSYLMLGILRFYYLKKIIFQTRILATIILLASFGLLLSLAWHFPSHSQLNFVIYILAGLNSYCVVANAVYFYPSLLRWLILALGLTALAIALDILLGYGMVEANPNILGGYLAPILILMPVLMQSKRIWQRIVFMTISLVLAYFILLSLRRTSSQAALIAAILGVYFFVVFRSIHISLWLTSLLILLLLPVGFVIRDQLSPVSFETERAVEGRLGIWIGSLYLVEDSPITGVGVGNYATAIKKHPIYARYIPSAATPEIMEDYYLLTKTDHAHNLYLHWIVEMGIPIGLIYILLAFTVLHLAVKTALNKDWVAAVICAAYITILANALFDMPLWASRPTLLFWIVMGMVTGYSQQPHRE